MTAKCTVSEVTLAHGVRAVQIENDLLAATVLIDKGADIYQLTYKPRAVDVLWKSPWGLKPPGRGAPSTFNSEAAWLEFYAGGWQVIFPNGGDANQYKGVELNFHGEACVIGWEHEISETGGDVAEARFGTRLYRSPFRIVRTMRVEAGHPMLVIRERITNQGGESMDYMWGHHPAFGAPFLSGACRIDAGARSFWVDDVYTGAANPLTLNARCPWPLAEKDGAAIDLSRVPDAQTPRDILVYLEDFESGWYAVTNHELGFGVGLAWPKDIFPYAWFWQEMYANAGFPWYKGAYVMAIEPFSSVPGQGLSTVMQKTGTHRTLAPGESIEAELRTVFYESTAGVQQIEPDGTVVPK